MKQFATILVVLVSLMFFGMSAMAQQNLIAGERHIGASSAKQVLSTPVIKTPSVVTGERQVQASNSVPANVVSKPEIRYVKVPYPVEAPKAEDRMDYKVFKGDTLTKVAGYFNTTIDVLWVINPAIKNPRLIRVDQVLKVPKPYTDTREGKLAAANSELQKRAEKADQKALNLSNLLAKANSKSNVYLYLLVIALIILVLAAALAVWALTQIRTIKQMVSGGQEIRVPCPHGCGERLSPKNYNRHVHTRCPDKPGAKQTSDAEAAAAA